MARGERTASMIQASFMGCYLDKGARGWKRIVRAAARRQGDGKSGARILRHCGVKENPHLGAITDANVGRLVVATRRGDMWGRFTNRPRMDRRESGRGLGLSLRGA